MKKIILIVLFLVISIFSYLIVSPKTNKVVNNAKQETSEVVTKTDVVRFKGVVTNVHNGCWSDGICSIEVDGKWWVPIIMGGLRPPDSKPEIQGEVVGIVFNEDNESLGKKVEVYAKKIDENSLTIFGSKEYYVRVINE